MIYDIIVIGGGIAGLNTVYEITKEIPSIKIILLESTNRLGGRISTYYHSSPTYLLEEGAGRFSQKHTLLQKRIQEFHLEQYIHENSRHSAYLPVRNKSLNFDTIKLIQKVLKYSSTDSQENKISCSFLEYAKQVLTDSEIEFVRDSFGYYSELAIMNAHDCMYLMKQLNYKNHFFSLSCGMSKIIQQMILEIQKIRSDFYLLNHLVVRIHKRSKEKDYEIICSNHRSFFAKHIICAVPKQFLEKIPFFKSIRPVLSNILCAPLCRIYCRFEVIPGKKIWFSDISRSTTNNMLRMIIPISSEKGTIMISYSDNRFAQFWKRCFDSQGEKGIILKLREYVLQSTGITIPEPLETHLFYWPCGVGYWGIGANSNIISREIIQPFASENVFVCGEHYSEKNQQWIEGALETSHRVVHKLLLTL